MSKLTLRRLIIDDEISFKEALNSWDNDPGFVFARGYEPHWAFSDYLRKLESNEKGFNLPEGFVPDTALFAFVGKTVVGRLSLRHELNTFLLNQGGHIGYGVLPEYRRRGFAKEMLRLSLPVAASLGLTRVLLTCDETNIGSIKTIEYNSGQLENRFELGDGRPAKLRYWIDL